MDGLDTLKAKYLAAVAGAGAGITHNVGGRSQGRFGNYADIQAGAIDGKQKELIALAIGITQRCSGCIGFHVKALHKLGCTRAELEDMLAICVYMGGGPALMYAGETLKAWDDLDPAKA